MSQVIGGRSFCPVCCLPACPCGARTPARGVADWRALFDGRLRAKLIAVELAAASARDLRAQVWRQLWADVEASGGTERLPFTPRAAKRALWLAPVRHVSHDPDATQCRAMSPQAASAEPPRGRCGRREG